MVNKRRIRRKIILPSMLALAILVVAILSTNTLYAKSSYSPIMTKYSQYFNLLESEEQDTSYDATDEKNADRYARFAEKLNDLELAGKITESQKEKILDNYEYGI